MVQAFTHYTSVYTTRSPNAECFIERKTGHRRELLNAYIFTTMRSKEHCEKWRQDYNTERPHKSLQYQSPLMFAENGANVQNMHKALSTNGERKSFSN
ncbi:MAG: transposase [Chitinophagaceae bacterium]|nr:transposase [Chitinophagaceae bacterium]